MQILQKATQACSDGLPQRHRPSFIVSRGHRLKLKSFTYFLAIYLDAYPDSSTDRLFLESAGNAQPSLLDEMIKEVTTTPSVLNVLDQEKRLTLPAVEDQAALVEHPPGFIELDRETSLDVVPMTLASTIARAVLVVAVLALIVQHILVELRFNLAPCAL